MNDLRTLTMRIAMREFPNRNVHAEHVLTMCHVDFSPLELVWISMDTIKEYLLTRHNHTKYSETPPGVNVATLYLRKG